MALIASNRHTPADSQHSLTIARAAGALVRTSAAPDQRHHKDGQHQQGHEPDDERAHADGYSPQRHRFGGIGPNALHEDGSSVRPPCVIASTCLWWLPCSRFNRLPGGRVLNSAAALPREGGGELNRSERRCGESAVAKTVRG